MDGENPGRDDRYNNPGCSDNQNCEAWKMERNPGNAKPIPKPRVGYVGKIRKFIRGDAGKDSG